MAFKGPPTPLHPDAEHFYKDQDLLKRARARPI
jgi:hypothetical protein